MKHLTTLLLPLLFFFSSLSFSESYKKEEVLERHYERIKEKLPLMMDTWDPPNNEPECVTFRCRFSG